MFPNPQDALPLPPRPNLEQYKKRAKDLLKASRSADSAALRSWATDWVQSLVRLAAVQITPGLPIRIDRWIDQVEDFARRKMPVDACALTDAQFVIARAHGFESWPRLAQHIEAIGVAGSSVSHFEQAADAIVTADVATLGRLLREHPTLIQARSTREHGATLLHYISANGVEGYRQKTPKAAVKVAQMLLDAGAEVDAAANVYGGGATTLALLATSVHPERAGVQEELMALLLDHGASLDGAVSSRGDKELLVNACLANGRSRAAESLASRGGRLNLEGAAGIGRLDLVKTFFDERGHLNSKATRMQMERAFLFACQYGRRSVIEFLLEKGVSLATQADMGQTGLHWAVIGGQLETIQLLLDRGAQLEARNEYGGTALGQALWSAVHADGRIDYVPVIKRLLEAGALIEDGTLGWLAQQRGISLAVKQAIVQTLLGHGARS